MANFTPGPWQVDEMGVITYFDLEYHRDCQIARVPDCEDETQMANANLIAAAPYMYEALKDAIDTYDDPNPGIVNWEHFIPIFRAAVAKAEGGQQ